MTFEALVFSTREILEEFASVAHIHNAHLLQSLETIRRSQRLHAERLRQAVWRESSENRERKKCYMRAYRKRKVVKVRVEAYNRSKARIQSQKARRK